MNNLVVVNGGRDTWALWNILIFIKIQTDELFWTLWVNSVTHWTPRSHTLNYSNHHAPAFHLDDPYSSIFIIQRYITCWTRKILHRLEWVTKTLWDEVIYLGLVLLFARVSRSR